MISTTDTLLQIWNRRISRISFVLFLVAVFVGTTMPFGDVITDIADKTTSNVLNQVVFISLFLSSAFCLCTNWNAAWRVGLKEKFLLAFLAWCLLSTAWSDYSIVSLKRFFQLITGTMVFAAMLLNVRSSQETMKYFEGVLYVCLVLSILSVLFIPGAMDPQFQTWRALAPSKNHLGQFAIISGLISFHGARSKHGRARIVSLLMLAIALALLVGSWSVTSMLTFASVTLLGAVFWIIANTFPRHIAVPYSVATCLALTVLGALALRAYPGIFQTLTESFGKDATFSGRTDLWVQMWREASGHILVGTGFAGFWVMDNPDLLWLYEDFVWLPNQAHMGYLDLLNETGIVGVFLVAGMVVAYFINLLKLKQPCFWQWFLISALISNLQESTFFRANCATGVMFTFAYMALQADLAHEEEAEAAGATLPPTPLPSGTPRVKTAQ